LSALLRLNAAVGKSSVLFAVSVKIYAHLHSIPLLELRYLLFDLIDLRLNLLGGIFPGTIEVTSCKVASEVAINNSVNVQHWKNVKIIVLEKPFALRRTLLNEKLHDILGEIGRPSLS